MAAASRVQELQVLPKTTVAGWQCRSDFRWLIGKKVGIRLEFQMLQGIWRLKIRNVSTCNWVLIDDRNITSFPYPFLHPKDMNSWEVFLSTKMFLLNDVPEVDVQLHDRTMTTPVD